MAYLKNRKRVIKTTSRLKYRKLYSKKWREYSYRYRCDHPQCIECHTNIHPKDGNRLGVVDHIIPVDSGTTEEERYKLMWDAENHQPMCAKCHNSKSGKEQ